MMTPPLHPSNVIRLADLIFLSLALSACANHQPVTPRADGTFVVSTQGNYIFNVDKARSENIKEAEDYANEKKMELRIVHDDLETGSTASRIRGHKLIFRLVDPHHEMLKKKSCFEDIHKNPSLGILSDKMSLVGAKEQTFSMLASKQLPTAAEREAIALYGDLRKICYDIGEKAAKSAGVPEAILALDYGSSSVGDQLLVALHGGEMTYGEFARHRKKIADIRQEGLAKIERELQRIGPGSLLRAIDIAKNTNAEMEKALEKRMPLTHSERVFKEIDPTNLDDDDY